MTFDVFYCSYQDDKEVPSTSPVPMEDRDIYVFVFEILEHPEDFFGIIDKAGTTLQIMLEPDDVFWTEIPDVARKGSHGAGLTFDQLVDVLKHLPKVFTPQMIPGATLTLW